MLTWPLIQRNKVEDSKVSIPVETFVASENQGLSSLAKQVREQLTEGAITHIKVAHYAAARAMGEP